MKPIRIVASLVLCLAAIGIAANDCNPINAVTSASGKFKIKSGQAYATSAKITWWDYYDDGDQQAFKYGTTTAYGSTINLLPFTGQTDITTTIENLTPNTKYYLQVYRTFESNIKQTLLLPPLTVLLSNNPYPMPALPWTCAIKSSKRICRMEFVRLRYGFQKAVP